MNLAVYLSLPIIIIFGIIGYRDGVIKRIIEIAGAFVALLLTARFATGAAPWVMKQTGLEEGPALLITWAGLFFAGLLLSRLLATLLSRVVRLTILGGLDRIGGAVVGMALGMLVASVILVAASQVPGGQAIQASYDEAPVGRFIFYSAPNLYQFVRGLSGGKADGIWQRALDTTKDKAGQLKEEVQEKIDDAKG